MVEITEIQKKLMHSTIDSADHIKLYFYKKRTKKGETYFECANTIIDKLDQSYAEVIKTTHTFLDEKEISDYMPDMPKNVIGFFDLTSETNLLKDGVESFTKGIVSASEFDTAINYSGYIIEFLKDDTFIRLIFSAKAIRTYTKRFGIFNNEFKQFNNPMFEIRNCPDCIWANDYILFLTAGAETIFDLEKHYKLIAQKALTQIEESNLLTPEHMNFFKNYVLVGRRPQKFETYREDRFNIFLGLPADKKKELLKDISISMENEKISILNEEDAKVFLDFMCCKILDDFTGEKYIVSNSQRFNHSVSQN